ncbi:MAG: dihydroflavonol-4-reductase [Bacteroidia bacterium]|jgi:dihydroflavonol-4-reductase
MVFVTGGTGLVGSHLICQLLSDGHQVRALCRSDSDKSWFVRTAKWVMGDQYESSILRLEWFEGDVTDVIALSDAIHGCSQVYHAAAVVSFAKRDQEQLRKINVAGTSNVVNVCLGSESKPDLCFISSTASIGGVEKKLVDESVPYLAESSNSYYSTTKYSAELEVIRGREEGLNAVIINPCIVLGFGNWNTGSAKFFKNGKNGFPFYTGGSNAFVDARDVAKGSVLLMSNQCFDGKYLCTAWNKKFLEVFQEIALSFGTKPPRFHVSKGLAEFAWRVTSFIRFFTGTGIITKESARAGLKHMSYSSKRLVDRVNMDFKSFEESIAEISEAYQQMEA